MPYDSSYYSSSTLGRRSTTSSSRWSSNTGSHHGHSNTAYTSLNSSSAYSPSPLSSMSMYLPPRSPIPSSPSLSHRNIRQPTSQYATERALSMSSAMSKRDTIIRNLVRSSHDLDSHHFLSNDSVSMITGVNAYYPSHRQTQPSQVITKSSRYSRCLTTDLSNASAIASTSIYRPSTPSYTVPNRSYRDQYRPIVIERPSLSNYVPRSKEERSKALPRAIRRDRPLVKFREREDLNPIKVRLLLDAWSKGENPEEEAACEDEAGNRKRDSVRSNDSGIGSYRSSFLRSSRKKSGDTVSESSQLTPESNKSDIEDSERHADQVPKTHTPSVDEGVNFDVDEGFRTPTPAMSPLGFRDDTVDLSDKNKVKNDNVSGKSSTHFLNVDDACIDTGQIKRRVRINADKYVECPNDKTRIKDDNNNKECSKNLCDKENLNNKDISAIKLNSETVIIPESASIKSDSTDCKNTNIIKCDTGLSSNDRKHISLKTDNETPVLQSMSDLTTKKPLNKSTEKIEYSQRKVAIENQNIENKINSSSVQPRPLEEQGILKNVKEATSGNTFSGKTIKLIPENRKDIKCINNITTCKENVSQIEKSIEKSNESHDQTKILMPTGDLPVDTEIKKKKKVKKIDCDVKTLKDKKVKLSSENNLEIGISFHSEIHNKKVAPETQTVSDLNEANKKANSVATAVDSANSSQKLESNIVEMKSRIKTDIPPIDPVKKISSYKAEKLSLETTEATKIKKSKPILTENNKALNLNEPADGTSQKVISPLINQKASLGWKMKEKLLSPQTSDDLESKTSEVKTKTIIHKVTLKNETEEKLSPCLTAEKNTTSDKLQAKIKQTPKFDDKSKSVLTGAKTELSGVKEDVLHKEKNRLMQSPAIETQNVNRKLGKINEKSILPSKECELPAEATKLDEKRKDPIIQKSILNSSETTPQEKAKQTGSVDPVVNRYLISPAKLKSDALKLPKKNAEQKVAVDAKKHSEEKQIEKTKTFPIHTKREMTTKEIQEEKTLLNQRSENEQTKFASNLKSTEKKPKETDTDVKDLTQKLQADKESVVVNENQTSVIESEIKITTEKHVLEKKRVNSRSSGDLTVTEKADNKGTLSEVKEMKQKPKKIKKETTSAVLKSEIKGKDNIKIDTIVPENKEILTPSGETFSKAQSVVSKSDSKISESNHSPPETNKKHVLLKNKKHEPDNVESKQEVVNEHQNAYQNQNERSSASLTNVENKEKDFGSSVQFQANSSIITPKPEIDENRINELTHEQASSRDDNNKHIPDLPKQDLKQSEKEQLIKLQKSASASLSSTKKFEEMESHSDKLRRSSTTEKFELLKCASSSGIVAKTLNFPNVENKKQILKIQNESDKKPSVNLNSSIVTVKGKANQNRITRSTTENLTEACEKLNLLQKSSSTDCSNLEKKLPNRKISPILKQLQPSAVSKSAMDCTTPDVNSKILNTDASTTKKIQRSMTGEIQTSRSTEKPNLLQKSSSVDNNCFEQKTLIQQARRLQKPPLPTPLPKKSKSPNSNAQSIEKAEQNSFSQNENKIALTSNDSKSDETESANEINFKDSTAIGKKPIALQLPAQSTKSATTFASESTTSIERSAEDRKIIVHEIEIVEKKSLTQCSITDAQKLKSSAIEKIAEKVDILDVTEIPQMQIHSELIDETSGMSEKEIQGISDHHVPSMTPTDNIGLNDVAIPERKPENIKVLQFTETVQMLSVQNELIIEAVKNDEAETKKVKVKKEKRAKTEAGEKPKKKKKKKTPLPDSSDVGKTKPSDKPGNEGTPSLAEPSIESQQDILIRTVASKELKTSGEKLKNPPEGQPFDLDNLWGDYSHTSGELSKNGPFTFESTTFPKRYTIEDFNLLKVLGRGSYGKVMLAELKGRNQYFAVKCLKKDVVLEDNDVECTMIEREVLAMGSSHPYLCTLYFTFQNEGHLFFVMEYLSGGDLMFHIQQSGKFDQDRARFYAAEIVCALKYLHKHGIIYRDAKLDNICIDADGHVRLVDFGFCKLRIYRKECLPRNLCGTPDYMAPEIIKGYHYNQSVDWWSFGVLLYEMLIGQSPFNGNDEEELFWSVCNEEAHYPRFLSKEATDLITLLLDKNHETRLGMPGCPAGDIFCQSFFRPIDWNKVEKKELEPPFKPKLKSETDVSNFDSDFTMENAALTPTDKEILDTLDQTQFIGFNFTNPMIFEWSR